MDSYLSAIIVGQSPELQQDVLAYNIGHERVDEIRSFITSYSDTIQIEDDKGCVWQLLQLYSLLNKVNRRELFPKSSTTQGYTASTEMNLFCILACSDENVRVRGQKYPLILSSFLLYNDAQRVTYTLANPAPTQWKTKTEGLLLFWRSRNLLLCQARIL